MKLFFLISLMAFFFFQQTAFGKEIFACEGKTKIFEPGSTLHFRLSQDKEGKYLLRSNGMPADEQVKFTQVDLSNIGAFLKCDSYDSKCLDAVVGTNKSFQNFASVVAVTKAISKDVPGEAQNSLSKINIRKMAYGRAYQIGESTKFGPMGVYEVYDKSDKLLGRYIYMIETMDCVNKAQPTKDISKMLQPIPTSTRAEEKSGTK